MENKKDMTNETADNVKISDLSKDVENAQNQFLTTNQGLRVNDDFNQLKAGPRGATLLEDFIYREKMTHFDHERIPERVVHARGVGAHGIFKLYEPLNEFTKAGFLTDTSRETPLFVRFSTVAGSRGSSDLARDVRGFAVKFYTEEGNFDLVGNNIPVFFIQDATKFPDFIHAVKPEPHNEIPQAASAHDTFYDFISLMPESIHMLMWVMSDRALPRSLRMMEGFGVHTFRLVNDEGKSCFVKFHWKPLLGVHSVAWTEAQGISGKDPDFHRRDLWEAIENGDYPEWELGLQIVPEEDEFKYEFDLLDATKLIPEELVPVRRVGKMTLNRNVDNYFAETEQVAFHLGHVVPGIDFTNDPLLQGRLFSYTDTQLLRLGGPNFHQIPINRSVAPVHNNQRDGLHQHTINKGGVSYSPNSIGGGCPYQAMMSQGGFTSYAEKIDAKKVRERSRSFFDHYSQARLFFNSQSEPEQMHIIKALTFELGKVNRKEIKLRLLRQLNQIDNYLATEVAYGIGLQVPADSDEPLNAGVPADADVAAYQPYKAESSVAKSDALSMKNTIKNTIKTRKIAFLTADGVNDTSVMMMKAALEKGGAMAKIIAPRGGFVLSENGKQIPVDESYLTAASVLYDAVYVPGGAGSVATIAADADAVQFLNEAFKHCKAIAADTDAMNALAVTYFANKLPDNKTDIVVTKEGIIIGSDAKQMSEPFIEAIAQHRFWERETARKVPA